MTGNLPSFATLLTIGALAKVVLSDVTAISPANFELSATASILGVAKTLAEETLQYYPGDASVSG